MDKDNFDTSHGFDPITSSEIDNFYRCLEHGETVDMLQLEMASRAITDFSEHYYDRDAAEAGAANSDDVAFTKEILSKADPDSFRIADY